MNNVRGDSTVETASGDQRRAHQGNRQCRQNGKSYFKNTGPWNFASKNLGFGTFQRIWLTLQYLPAEKIAGGRQISRKPLPWKIDGIALILELEAKVRESPEGYNAKLSKFNIYWGGRSPPPPTQTPLTFLGGCCPLEPPLQSAFEPPDRRELRSSIHSNHLLEDGVGESPRITTRNCQHLAVYSFSKSHKHKYKHWY